MRKRIPSLLGGQAIIAISLAYTGTTVQANINLEFRAVNETVIVGQPVNLGLYAVSDDETDQLLAAAQVIFAWDQSVLQLLGLDNSGAVELLSSSFPVGDPFNLNEQVPPQDGDGLYVALALLGDSVAATPEGTLLTTFQFQAIAPSAATPIDILPFGGKPEGDTIVLDGVVPNLDVTGTLTGTEVQVLAESEAVTLTLHVISGLPAGKGDVVVIGMTMSNLGKAETVGCQAFLEFDSSELTFIEGEYTDEPFGLPIIDPIIADGEEIDLASGIDVKNGQKPTSEDATLALLTFEVLEGGCISSLQFRDHDPPTRLTDKFGASIKPFVLAGMLAEPRTGDLDGDGKVIIGWGM